MKIRIFLSDLCSGCKELESRLVNYRGNDLEVNKLDEEAVSYIVEQAGELKLPAAYDEKGNKCTISKEGDKIVIKCPEKTVEI